MQFFKTNGSPRSTKAIRAFDLRVLLDEIRRVVAFPRVIKKDSINDILKGVDSMSKWRLIYAYLMKTESLSVYLSSFRDVLESMFHDDVYFLCEAVCVDQQRIAMWIYSLSPPVQFNAQLLTVPHLFILKYIRDLPAYCELQWYIYSYEVLLLDYLRSEESLVYDSKSLKEMRWALYRGSEHYGLELMASLASFRRHFEDLLLSEFKRHLSRDW